MSEFEHERFRHFFCDHQHCLKCGKWEGDSEADDCISLTHGEFSDKLRSISREEYTKEYWVNYRPTKHNRKGPHEEKRHN